MGKWQVFDESMLYPPLMPPIPFFLFNDNGTPNRFKMVLCCDTPESVSDVMHVRELAENEIVETHGRTAVEMLDAIERGFITVDIVFADELIDARKKAE